MIHNPISIILLWIGYHAFYLCQDKPGQNKAYAALMAYNPHLDS